MSSEIPPRPDPRERHARLSHRSRSSRLTADRIVRFLLTAGVLVLLAGLLWYFSTLMIYLIIGVLLSYLMRPMVDRIQGLGLTRIPAILVSFVIVFGIITVLLTRLVPFAAEQISDLSEQVSFQTVAEVTAVLPAELGEEPPLLPGEVILAVDGQAWESIAHFRSLLRAKEPGELVYLLVENEEGAQRYTSVAVQEVDADTARLEEDDTVVMPEVGITVREVTTSDVAAFIERRIRRVVPVQPGTIVEGITRALEQVAQEEQIRRYAGSVVGIFTNIFYAVIVIPFVAFFFLKDGPQIRHTLFQLVPNRYFELTLALVEKIEMIVGRYFRALLLQGLSVATVATLLLTAVGLNYAVAVGVFTGLANTIPYFGPFMGLLAGTLVAIVQTGDFSLVPGIVVAMALTQIADNAVFQPFIFSRAARTHPLMILLAVLIGAQVAGIIGMLVAIPVLTILRVTIEQVLWSVRNYRILRQA